MIEGPGFVFERTLQFSPLRSPSPPPPLPPPYTRTPPAAYWAHGVSECKRLFIDSV